MKALPAPAWGGSVETLRSFLNVKRNSDFVLAISWVLAALRDCGPYPVLALSGEQGSAKSTFAAILRALIDPNTAPLRAHSRDQSDPGTALHHQRECKGLGNI
jgi:ABC-type antimicrobial peptide transport system ATPase subunit